MTCSYCDAALPSYALFCGECGRAVTKKAPRSGRAVPRTPDLPAPQPGSLIDSADGAQCAQCRAPVSLGDIFCGECGFVVASTDSSSAKPADTNVIDRLEQVEVREPEETDSQPQPERAPDAEPEPALDPVPELEPELELDPVPELVPEPEVHDEVEATRISPHPLKGERFVLQFSTGESFTVFGSGLVGRSPKPEPTEFFDTLVRIADATRSVSKTHLEFGQEAGSFWVKDRFSGNGTIVREPESPPMRCHPERRYRLVRGSRVDLGEQFFIVS